MSKHLLLGAAALLLAACQPAGTGSGEQASSADSMMAASEDAMMSGQGEAGALAVVGAWAPSLSWSAPAAGTNADTIHIDDARTIGAGMIQTQEMTAKMTPEVYAKYVVDQRSALDAAMAKNGWSPLSSLDADGAIGSQWGYMKADDAGESFVIVQVLGNGCGDGIPACTSYTATVEQTATLAPGDDL